MFEFDEHFDELEAMELEGDLLRGQEESILPLWANMGNDVWKLSLDMESSVTSQSWRLETEDVA